jgi:pimeloyl-ACP methyl ester carboxylesterase
MSWKKRILWAVGAVVVPVLVIAAGFWLRPVSYFNAENEWRMCLSGAGNHSVEVAGHRVHYVVEGPAGGPAVVLVHGLGGRVEDWRNLAPMLAQAGFRVYMPDLIGFGRSEKPADFSYSVPDEAEVVVGFLDALGLKRVDLAGWSMGGGIAQHLAFKHPERVRRLILIDAIGINEKPAWDTRLFTPTTPAELDQLDALLMPNPPEVPAFVARDILRVSNQRAWIVHRAMATMLTGRDATDELLPQLKMPVLIVWGAEDRMLPLSQGERMHSLAPQSQLAVIAGCGHLAPVQCAGQIGPVMVEFEKRQAGSGR